MRFAAVSEDSVDKMIIDKVKNSTKKSTKVAVGIFQGYLWEKVIEANTAFILLLTLRTQWTVDIELRKNKEKQERRKKSIVSAPSKLSGLGWAVLPLMLLVHCI